MRRVIDYIKFNILDNYLVNDILSSKLARVIFFTVIIIIIIMAGFFISEKNYFYGILFYPDKTNSKLIYERRAIQKGKNKKERLDNIVSELLLGPLSPEIKNFFTKDSKLLNSWLDKDVYYLNLTEETLMNIEWRKNNKVLIYDLIIKSIVNSIYINERSIKKVKIYFNNKEYKYAGNTKIEEELKPDWKILLK